MENCKYRSNFDIKNKEQIIKVLREHFYEYIINNNDAKNNFHDQQGILKDYTEELNKEEIEAFFDKVIEGVTLDEKEYSKARVIQGYIARIVGNYPLEDILNNFRFIMYDLKNKNSDTLDERRKNYNEHKDLDDTKLVRVKNVEVLRRRLKTIDNEKAKELLRRLDAIEDPYASIDELDDIYLEYEAVFREDIVDHLYVPEQEETIVEDFRDVKPQLIHLFLRNPDKTLRGRLEEELKKSIIEERTNGSKDPELTEEEKEVYEKRLHLLNAEINQTQVNYSFDSSVSMYSDDMSTSYYISDTDNQISASIFHMDYFLVNGHGMFGIGFNAEGLDPESIAISSPSYVTTNKGLNNLTYDESTEFTKLSAPFADLANELCDSEVVLHRRGVESDTKASYVFVAVDKDRKDADELIEKARKLAKENGLKLVIYDLKKIRESKKKYDELMESDSKDVDENIEDSVKAK